VAGHDGRCGVTALLTTDPLRLGWAAGAVVLWLVFTVVMLWRGLRAQPAKAQDGGWLIAVASQTGFAEELAEMTEALLAPTGPVRTVLLGDLEVADLKAAGRVLFVVSTTGEGDAPDSASWFVRKVMGAEADLHGVRYGLLALGDHNYKDFCAFGRALDGWLRRAGAEALFDAVEVDNGEAGAVRHWQHQVAAAVGATAEADWTPPALDRWRLVERRLMNPGSPGGAAYHLAFEPLDGPADWAAGDIAEIGLPAVDGTSPGSREYSIASLPSDGRLELLLRLMMRPDGSPGLASGWLTLKAAVGDEVAMRTRTNRSFHGPARETPMILIGNGTGLAGLRAHLKARSAAPSAETWLLFGERTAAHDSFYEAELQGWCTSGALTRLDRAFSRDTGDGRYVQALITEHAAEIAAWAGRGAVIYVCGSLDGMAPGVHAALEGALGTGRLAELTEAGRYRRDVY
jgi:sulfite reductase (NADPH) flavoprotein alpha-component